MERAGRILPAGRSFAVFPLLPFTVSHTGTDPFLSAVFMKCLLITTNLIFGTTNQHPDRLNTEKLNIFIDTKLQYF
jgi:hypothetical protein